jgi:hypothetical protein
MIVAICTVVEGLMLYGSNPPNKVCTPANCAGAEPAGRLGLCAFFELVLNLGSFPFPSLFLPSRRYPYRVLRERQPLGCLDEEYR